MKKLILLTIAIGFSTVLFSQTTSDALRYSRIFYEGTARFQGLGGAFGALGADFSVLQTNPAGIGIYRSSEITFGPSLSFNSSESEYLGYKGNETKFNGALANLGMVFTIKTGKKTNFNVGFGINRQTNFQNRVYIRGANDHSSILTDWTDILNTEPFLDPEGISVEHPFDIALAYDANLIYDPGNGYYTSDIENGGVFQEKTITTKGSMNEFNITFGGNYNDKVYFGATLGVPYLRYFETSTYKETNNDASIQHFESLRYRQELETYGTGLNLKLGVIVKPADWVRLGVAVHTPTWFGNMRDNWESRMTSAFYDSTAWNNTIDSPLGSFDYQMSTPFRAIGSVAFILGTNGLISAEYEYVNYGSARFYENGDESDIYQDLNDNIAKEFKSPLNLRAGTEWRINDFRIRGGVGYYGSPYTSSGTDGSKLSISGGVGYRGKHFFSDLSYVWSKTSDNYYLYYSDPLDPAKITTIGNTITATFGIRF